MDVQLGKIFPNIWCFYLIEKCSGNSFIRNSFIRNIGLYHVLFVPGWNSQKVIVLNYSLIRTFTYTEGCSIWKQFMQLYEENKNISRILLCILTPPFSFLPFFLLTFAWVVLEKAERVFNFYFLLIFNIILIYIKNVCCIYLWVCLMNTKTCHECENYLMQAKKNIVVVYIY